MLSSRLRSCVALAIAGATLGSLVFVGDRASANDANPQYAIGKLSVMLRHGALIWPEGATVLDLEALTVTDAQLDSLLHAGGVATVKKLFPHCAPHDTLKIARDGLLVRVPDLSQAYVLRTQADGFSAEFLDALRSARPVLLAERVPLVRLFSWSDPPAADSLLLNVHWRGVGVSDTSPTGTAI